MYTLKTLIPPPILLKKIYVSPLSGQHEYIKLKQKVFDHSNLKNVDVIMNSIPFRN